MLKNFLGVTFGRVEALSPVNHEKSVVLVWFFAGFPKQLNVIYVGHLPRQFSNREFAMSE